MWPLFHGTFWIWYCQEESWGAPGKVPNLGITFLAWLKCVPKS